MLLWSSGISEQLKIILLSFLFTIILSLVCWGDVPVAKFTNKTKQTKFFTEIENLLNEKVIVEGLDYNRNNDIFP